MLLIVRKTKSSSFTPLPDIMREFHIRSPCIRLKMCFLRFLDLMTSAPQSFFVPTLDIDLAWHTHQMKGEVYQTDCRKSIRRYIDQYVETSFELRATRADIMLVMTR